METEQDDDETRITSSTMKHCSKLSFQEGNVFVKNVFKMHSLCILHAFEIMLTTFVRFAMTSVFAMTTKDETRGFLILRILLTKSLLSILSFSSRNSNTVPFGNICSSLAMRGAVCVDKITVKERIQ